MEAMDGCLSFAVADQVNNKTFGFKPIHSYILKRMQYKILLIQLEILLFLIKFGIFLTCSSSTYYLTRNMILKIHKK